jgi:D-alanyl-D-alanine endopeptidase (penicillin-binding protein 7)
MRHLAAVVVLGVLARPTSAAPRADDLPEVKSRAVVVLDARTGAEIFSKAADDVRPIASTTKIFVAMAVRKHALDLEGWTEINRVDAKEAAGGARTRLDIGEKFRNRDLLRAMLMASDNRAPTALGRAAGMDPDELVRAMNKLAKELGLAHTKFTSPSGLHGNVSTAREMAIAMDLVLHDKVLAKIMRTRYARITSKSEAVTIDYKSTVRPLWGKGARIRGGKTGTTEAAGHCMLIGAVVQGHDVVMAFLGGETDASRFMDYARAVHWLEHP